MAKAVGRMIRLLSNMKVRVSSILCGSSFAAIAASAERLSGPCALMQLCREAPPGANRSEEHTSELQSLMRISYAVFCLKKKTHSTHTPTTHIITKNTTQQHTNLLHTDSHAT